MSWWKPGAKAIEPVKGNTKEPFTLNQVDWAQAKQEWAQAQLSIMENIEKASERAYAEFVEAQKPALTLPPLFQKMKCPECEHQFTYHMEKRVYYCENPLCEFPWVIYEIDLALGYPPSDPKLHHTTRLDIFDEDYLDSYHKDQPKEQKVQKVHLHDKDGNFIREADVLAGYKYWVSVDAVAVDVAIDPEEPLDPGVYTIGSLTDIIYRKRTFYPTGEFTDDGKEVWREK